MTETRATYDVNHNVIISIDPGQQSGWCEFQDGKIRELYTYSPREVVLWLEHAIEYWTYPPSVVVIEDSRMISYLFNEKRTNGGKASAIKIARNVGMVDGLCGIIQEICATYKVMLISVSPKEKGAKLDAAAFKAMTGWEGRTNSHERDAAMVGWSYRRGAS